MDKGLHSAFKELLEDISNQKCIDCGKCNKGMVNPQWASVNNGIFLCLNCSGIHRSLGVEVSIIKSIVMDNFTESEITKMKIGGNKNFNEFIEFYKLTNEAQHIKYFSKACDYYRRRV